MVSFEVERFIFELKKDEVLQQALKARSPSTFDGFTLRDEERNALRDGDIESLYRMGVHPLLLAPYSRYVGIASPDYHQRLDALKGVQTFNSERRFVKATNKSGGNANG